MTPFLAIVKLTCRSTIRSHVFRTLFVLLLLAVLLIPNTVKSDGTAAGFIQLILEYSLGITSAILVISSAWVICSEVCFDIENGQIALLAVKPVSRLKILLGKVTGVLLIHTVLLVFSFAAVYGLVMYQFSRQDFTEAERKRVNEEILCGRRMYEPVRRDYDKLAKEELSRRLSKATQQDLKNLAMRTDGGDRRAMLADVRKELQGADCEVAPGKMLFWDFEGIKPKDGAPVFLKYTVICPEAASKGDPTYGHWVFRLNYPKDETANPKDPKTEFVEQFVPTAPGDVPLSSAREIPVQRQIFQTFNQNMTDDTPIPDDSMIRLTNALTKDGHFRVGFRSLDKRGKNLVFQEPDGPFLLIHETGFLNNFLRALSVSFFGIAAVTFVAGGISACFVLPVALFLTACYGLLSVIANYLFSVLQYSPYDDMTGVEKFGLILSKALLFFMIPFQNFFLSSHLATGQLIEWGQIGSLFFFGLLCRGFLLFLICSFFYKRKEIALFMKR